MMKKGAKAFLIIVALLVCTNSAQAQHPPYWDEIQNFKQQDSLSAPLKKAILFVGSSSFRMWKDVQQDFPHYNIINRGFGGSSLLDVIHYADDIIFPYHSKQIIIYCGENDLASSDSITAKIVFERFVTLYKMISNENKKVNVVFVSIKPSPSRQSIQGKVIESNNMIASFLKKKRNTAFVNVYDLMIDAHGEPKKELFLQDMLHMNPDGYAIWKKAIEPYLLK